MMICEGCIKQDVCKFRDKVGVYEGTGRAGAEVPILGEPLEVTVSCKYKQNGDVTISDPWPNLRPYPWEGVKWTDGTTSTPAPFTYTS